MAETDAIVAERLRGRPPGWYPWRGEVARWWDGEKWGSARRPFADHLERRAPGRLIGRSRVRWGFGSALVLGLIGIVLWLTLASGSSPVGYRARVGALCTQTFARERAEILKQSTEAVAAHTSHTEAVLLGRLLRALVHDSFLFDARLEALTPPPSLSAAQERYLALERQDSAIYELVIPRLEGGDGLRALTPVAPLLSLSAAELQRLLQRLGGAPCSISPLG